MITMVTLTGLCERCILKIVTQKENFPIGDMYNGNAPIVVGKTVLACPCISPQNTNPFTFSNGLLYGKGQAGVFSEEYFEEEDNLFTSLYE